jgi:hypothetical protein
MKKYLLIVLLASMLAGCNYEFKKKGEVEKVTTVHMDVGKFQVVGGIDYEHSGRVVFTEIGGMEISSHISRCVIVTAVPKPAPPQVKASVKAPVQTPGKIPEKKPKK